MRIGGRASYHVSAQPPKRIRFILQHLGLDSEKTEGSGLLTISDWYTATLGRKSKEKLAKDSLKVADLSIELAKADLVASPRPDTLIVVDNISTMARFNEERAGSRHSDGRRGCGYRSRQESCVGERDDTVEHNQDPCHNVS